MAQSITLQTSDDDVIASDVLGRLSFAASNDSSGGDAILIGGSIYAMAEATFSAVSNPTSIIFATASSESATPKLKIESQGHFVPINNEVYDLGTSSYRFRSTYSENIETDKIVFISGSVPPVSVDNSAYNINGELFFSGSGVALLPSGGLENQILQKVNTSTNLLQWVDNYSTEVRVYVKNTTGSELTKGQAVYINSAQGDHPTIALAIASGESSSSKTLGLLYQNLAINEFGYVVAEGILEGVDTSAAGQAGDLMYLSPTTPGGIVYGLANKPSAPNHLVFLGYVIVKQQNNGKVFVKVQNGFEIEELHNVKIDGVTNGQYLVYNSSSGVWANQTVNPGGGTTITNYADNRILTSDGTSTGINAESNLIFDGTNLGIGTSSPSTKLEIFGTAGGGATVRINDGTQDLRLYTSTGIGVVGTISNSSLGFHTNNTEKMRITSAGNVGIGTSSPSSLLHVRNASGNSEILTQYGTGTIGTFGAYANQVDIKASNGTNDSITFTTGSTERIRITSTGNVGIGTSNPSNTLDVRGGEIYKTTTDFAFGTTGSLLSIYNGASTGNTYSAIGALSSGGSAWNNLVLQAGGGNVGIGTTSPSQKLQIVGNATLSGSLTVSTANTTGGGIILGDDGDIVDLNDGFCAMRFSSGVRIFSGNRTGSAVITLGSNGTVTATNFSATSSDSTLTKPTRIYASTDNVIRYHTLATFKAHMGLTGKNTFSRAETTGDSNYWVGSMGWGNTNYNTVFSWGSGFTDVWDNPANQPPGTSHWQGIQALHYDNGVNSWGFQIACGAGNPDLLYIRGAWGGAPTSWRRIVTENGGTYSINITGNAAGETLATVTGRGASTTTNITTTGAMFASNWYRSYNATGWYNETYTGGIWMSDSTWVRVYNNKQFLCDNIIQSGASVRAPIFYDSNDTAFYCDPNATSRFAGLVITGTDLYVGDGVAATTIRMRDSDEGERAIHCNSNRIGFLNQSGGWGSWCEDDGSWATDFAVYAPIFYDRNNTAYYLDPASTSVLNRVNPVGWDTSGRNYSREWIEFPNHTGLYSPLNGAHFYPNNGTHGAWRIAGTRNGWGGLEFDSTGAGNTSLMMNSNYTGVHNNSYGWQWYWTGGKFYVSTGTYGGGAIYPVVTGDSRNSRGATRLYRRDEDTDYSVQTYWTGARWRLNGYVGDTFHAGTEVAYADTAGSIPNLALNINQIDKVGHCRFGFESGSFYQDYVRGTIASVRRIAEGRYEITYNNVVARSVVVTSQNFHTVYIYLSQEVRVYNSANAPIDSRYISLLTFTE